VAADELAAATRRWDEKPYSVTGTYLEQAGQNLADVLPNLHSLLATDQDTVDAVAAARTRVCELANIYLSGELPASADGSMPLELAHLTYAIRSAQDALCGVAGAATGPAVEGW
jgi:hypothetical protein